MNKFIKKILRENLINEVRVINTDWMTIQKEEPLQDSDTLRVYHGFHNYQDAIVAAKFGLSGKERAKRIYSYESNNNPQGLFVTLDFDKAKDFTYPRGDRGITVIMELHVKYADLEAPVWPGGSYTVQGQMAQYWKDDNDRYENGTLWARERAKKQEIPFISQSDRPEVTYSLFYSENQALFMGDINPNMIRAVWFGESGSHAMSPKKLERLSVRDFLNKFESHEPEGERKYDDPYYDKKNKSEIFLPNEDFSMEKLTKFLMGIGYEMTGEEFLPDIIKYNELHQHFWPKQIAQIKKLYGVDQ